MHQINGFQTTDSFRFDRNVSASSTSLSSSSGYGSRLSLSPIDPSASSHRISISKYFKEKLARHKSLASLLPSLSPSRTEIVNPDVDIYDNVWDLDKQIEKLRVTVHQQMPCDVQSIVSMSVDTPKPSRHRVDDQDLMSVAAWYQEGLSVDICEEYLKHDDRPIGSFIIRCNYILSQCPFVLSIKTKRTLVEHFLIQRIRSSHGYRIHESSKAFVNLSTLVIHHTVIPENLPVTLVLPSTVHVPQQRGSSGIVRSVRF